MEAKLVSMTKSVW